MAKSLRSKIKRKFRGVKRERNAKKELERLKTMIAQSKENEAEMKELYTVRKRRPRNPEQMETPDEEGAGMDTSKPKPKVNPKTLKNEHGNYPVWMNRRQVRKKKKEMKKIATEKARKKRRKL